MKKLLSIILALTVFLSVFTVVGAADEAAIEVQIPEKYIDNIEMLKALGIGDFSQKDFSGKVTRGEFAQIIAGLLNASDMQVTNLPFLDVDKNNEYYNAVCAVYSYGIMNGVGATEFNPDGFITQEQAIKCMVCVLGYGDIAFTYPEDYVNLALRLKLLKNLGTNSDNFTWEKVIQLVINTFDVSIMTVHSVGTDSVVYQPDDKKTILGVYHNIYKSKGRVTDNGITTITGQPVLGRDYMIVNNIAGLVGDEELRSYIGKTVEFYYQADGTVTTILYFLPDTDAAGELVIKADDLAKDAQKFTKTNIVYYNENGKTINAKVNQYADMIYNGKSFPTFLASDIKIDAGTVTLIDNDNDSIYDLIVVEEYRDFIITSVDTVDQTISDENGNIYSYNPEKVHASFYNADLQSAGIDEFINGYIVSLFESKDGEYRKFVLSGKSATGTVDGFEEDEDGNVTISIEGVPYKYAPTFLGNIADGIRDEFFPKIGMNVKVYLNYEGKIASIDLAARDFLYAYCLAIAPKTGGMSNTVQLKVVTEKNDELILNAAKDVTINGVKSSPSDLLTIPAFENTKTGEFVPQLVRIKTNSDGELKMIMTATEQKTNLGFSDKDTFTLATSYGSGSTSGRGYGTYYSTDSDTVYFRIKKDNNYHEPEVMVIKTKPSAYANMKIYDVDEFWNAGALVFQDNDSYSNYMGRVFIVTKVFTTFDANRQPVKAIRGYQQSSYWTYVEAEEGLIDHYIPEGIKIGDIVQIQVDDAKNIRTINKMFSLADKQAPVTEGSITSDGISYVYGYLCNKGTSNVVISMDNYDLDATSNIQMRTVPTSAAVLLFDVQEKTLRTTTLREIPINATMQNDRYEIIDENYMVFAKTARASATEFIFIKY